MPGRVRRLSRLLAAVCFALLVGGCSLSSMEPGMTREPAPVAESEATGAPDTSMPEPARESGGETSSETGSSGAVAPAIALEPAALNVPEGGTGRYAVGLSAAPTGTVAVAVRASSAELTVTPGKLEFTVAGWQTEQTVTVGAAEDEDAVVDAGAEVLHTARGGGYDGAAAALTVLIVENDVPTLAVTGARAGEGSGTIGLEVSLSLAAARAVTVAYGTGAEEDDAAAGDDYEQGRGTLSFPANSTAAQTIALVVHDDVLDEDDERVTVTLSDAVGAVLAGGEATVTAVGVIEDDDPEPELSIGDASVIEGEGDLQFTVTLAPASGRTVTVGYASGGATGDAAATAGEDYSDVAGTLTFARGTTAQTISVPVLDDGAVEETETLTVTLSDATAAHLAVATATGSIGNDDPLQLDSLAVAGGGTMYPAFDPAILHYALTCGDSTTLQVTAGAARPATSLTLLRADPAQNQVASGAIDVKGLAVQKDHDIAIELSETGAATATYVVHCLPENFPEFKVLSKTAEVSDGLLLITPRMSGTSTFMVVLDNNGVARFHRAPEFSGATNHGAQDFRRHPDGTFSLTRTVKNTRNIVHLYDSSLEFVKTTGVVAPLETTNAHDFLVAPNGNYLFISYPSNERNLCEIEDYCDPGETTRMRTLLDSAIQEVTPEGEEVSRWNSWDPARVEDCLDTPTTFEGDYGHLNSLFLVDGDLVVSVRNCHQVLRLARSETDPGEWEVEWQVGGTEPDGDYAGVYLEITGDADGKNEICKQHSAVVTAGGNLLVFDNGADCLGARKADPKFTRIVEYDISSATQAAFVRQYKLPAGHGYSHIRGAVRELENGHWLIAWGNFWKPARPARRQIRVSEVDPASGAAVFELAIFRGTGSNVTYRAYREREADLDLPRNLP